MRLITASHITAWGSRNRRDCQGMLPLLVRYLVRATAERIDLIDFPAGDAVSDAGWDGRLECASSCPFVPDGISGWEIGTDKSAPGKAASDYAKRLANPLDLAPSHATFVFVTPRAWPDRQNWASLKRGDGTWRDVRAIAASDLEAWLETAPAVALWLARHIGLAPAFGLLGIEQWWARWAGGTEPAMTPSMLVAGRDREVEAVLEWFSSTSASSIEVQGDSMDESLAFLRAAADRWPEALRDTLFSRCVVAETEEAFDAAASWSTSAVIVAPADVARSAGLALRNGHRLFLAVGRTLATRGAALVRLPRVDRYALVHAIEGAGLPRERAVAIVVDCGASLAVLHRQRSPAGVARHPPWAEVEGGRAMIPLLLAGAWSDEIRPRDMGPFGPPPPPLLDHTVLCTLAGSADADAVTEPAHRYRSLSDAPFRQAAWVWQLTAPLDAWYALQDQLRACDFARLAQAAITVLSLPDPKFELPDEDQWLAQTKGKQRSHSGWLRQGLATSLAIVSEHGDARRWPVPYADSRGFAAGVVGRILYAQQDWRGWASLDNVLPILAEAAPDTFLAAVERLVEERPQEAKDLLTDGGGGSSMTGECRHAGLLWALERLAWHPLHLSRAVLCLAHLDAIDPGGRWSNRPFSSLCDILANGEPYTFADPAACLEAVDAIASARAGTAWRLLMNATMPLRGRMVRDPPAHLAACPDGWVPWTHAQRSAYGLGLCDRMTAMVEDADIDRLLDALGHVQHLPDQTQAVLCRRLETMHHVPVTDPADLLWTAVRSALHRMRSFGEDAEAESSTERVLAAVERALAPADPSAVGRWLFGNRMPQLPGGETLDWQANQERVRVARGDAVRSLLDRFGPAGLVTWAAGVHDQGTLGFSLAGITTENEDEALRQPMLALARAIEGRPHALLFGYAAGRSGDLTWFDNWLSATTGSADGAAAATLLCTRPFARETWKRVDDLPAEVQRLYWRWVSTWLPSDLDVVDAELAAERLLEAGRPAAILDWLTQRTNLSLSAQLLCRVARELVTYLNEPEAPDGGDIPWRIERLFERIDGSSLPEEDVATLELIYLPLLLPLYSKRGPRALHCVLARTPTIFVDCICNVWPNSVSTGEHLEADGRTEVGEAEKRRAHTSHDLLDSWRQPLPGQSGSEIDGEQLLAWIAEARRLCCERGRQAIGDVMIGKLLSGSPADPVDALWPHRSVRRALDEKPSRELDEGFTSGIINARGVTVRRPHDGGKLERIEQDLYTTWANGIRATYPRTARVLDQIAEHYRIDAVREDAASDLNNLRQI